MTIQPNRPIFEMMRIPATALLSAALLCACSGPITRHALYLPAPDAAQPADAAPPAVRVRLPHYVDTRALVRRGDGGVLRAHPRHEWAEPPADGMARLLQERLIAAGLLSDAGALLRVEFTRFEQEADGVFRARGNWQLRSGGARHAGGLLQLDLPVQNDAPDALVAAMSAAANDVAQGIIDALRAAAP